MEVSIEPPRPAPLPLIIAKPKMIAPENENDATIPIAAIHTCSDCGKSYKTKTWFSKHTCGGGKKGKQRVKKQRVQIPTEEHVSLIREFESSDSAGEPFQMAQIWIKIQRLGLDPDDVLETKSRIDRGCATLRSRFENMRQLIPIILGQ